MCEAINFYLAYFHVLKTVLYYVYLFMIILSWLMGTVATVPVPVSHDKTSCAS